MDNQSNISLHRTFYRLFTIFFILNFIIVLNIYPQPMTFRLASLFQDNMVLQQKRDAPIWGKGVPGTTVMIQSSWGKQVSTMVNKDSVWMTKLSTPAAGGPFQIFLRHGTSRIVIKNILAGEVWLCSGQSNMEMPLQGWPPNDTIANSTKEIDQALFPSIRLFTVGRSFDVVPAEQCVGIWTECTPNDVQDFSATAFYFGKMLHNTLKVPVGLIDASFGGTIVEAWMDKKTLQTIKEYESTLNTLEGSRDSIRILTDWVSQHRSITVADRDPITKYTGLKFDDDEVTMKNYEANGWREMTLPVFWEQSPLGRFDGVVWFRKQIIIPSSWIGKDLTVYLGPIDDIDESYVNGRKIGEETRDGYWNIDRKYTIPGSVIQDSVLQFAIRVIDMRGGGGLWGNTTAMRVTSNIDTLSISLAGNWKYLPVAEYRSGQFYIYGASGNEFSKRPGVLFDLSQNTPTGLYNSMINPLIPFAIKGAIWYQGESNVSNHAAYQQLFTSMITGWRSVFQSGDFPFYFVQIAPFNYGAAPASAFLREAQFKSLSLKNTGMAVTLDIGNPTNIHPANKEDVGKRLAFWALSKTYAKKISYMGPMYSSMKKEKGKIILSFHGVGKGLLVKEQNGEHHFTIAGMDKIFKKAVIKIVGGKIVAAHPEIAQPAAVRYCWSNTEGATLFNKDGFPATSFRTDEWPE